LDNKLFGKTWPFIATYSAIIHIKHYAGKIQVGGKAADVADDIFDRFSHATFSLSIHVTAREAFEEQVLAHLSTWISADEAILCPGLALKDIRSLIACREQHNDPVRVFPMRDNCKAY
jgi:hypothetical protein